jgi:glycerol-3-phosphate dehydrogenase
LFSSQLDPKQRGEALKSLATDTFDVLVIGGGVTGVGAALDAASRGLKVALVEASDLASGTSSRSSKLIHGGLRYLEQYDFKLVREALHERELMVSSLAPHLVKPLAFLYPLHEKVRERTYVGAGLALYDALRGFQRALPGHKHISQKKIAEIAPSLRPDIVTGAVKYFDAQVDDARHTMMIARTAARHGAVIATGVKVESLVKEGKRVLGVKARDVESGKLITIKATATVMCAGIWSDELHESFGLKAGYNVTMSKGVHIVLPKNAIKSKEGIILKTAVSVLFLIPWADKWIVGTTDTPYTGDRRNPLAERADVEYIINEANKVLKPKLKIEDVIGVYAGLRPLVANKKDSETTKLSREHTVDRSAPGFVSIAGGKYTTYRVMGKDVIDLAGVELRRIVADSVTEKLPIVGADGYVALTQQAERISEESGLSAASVIHLLNRYGSLISELLEIIKNDPKLAKPLTKDLPYLKAEIFYAASHEGARSVDDVISRRTRLAFEAPNSAMDLASDVATIIAPVLGWTPKQKKDSINAYIDIAEREIEAIEQALASA